MMEGNTPRIIVNRTDSTFLTAAVKILLDNVIGPEEVESVIKTDSKLKSEENSGDCEFCKKKCTNCQLCCSNKGLQLYLLNKAMERINSISKDCRNFLCRSENKQCDDKCSEECKEKLSKICKCLHKVKAFKQIKYKLKNLKKYYPSVYKFKGNIIEEWGKNEMLCKLKLDVLTLENNNTTIFWI